MAFHTSGNMCVQYSAKRLFIDQMALNLNMHNSKEPNLDQDDSFAPAEASFAASLLPSSPFTSCHLGFFVRGCSSSRAKPEKIPLLPHFQSFVRCQLLIQQYKLLLILHRISLSSDPALLLSKRRGTKIKTIPPSSLRSSLQNLPAAGSEC